MNLTQITVSYGATQSLPEYSNAKISLTLTATLDEGDSAEAVEAALWVLAKSSVHEQIDQALEANDKAAKYSTDPRFQVLYTYWSQWDHRGEEKPPQYVIIAPDAFKFDRDGYAQRLIVDSSNLRLAHAQKVVRARLIDTDEHRTLLDCSDGDLSRLEAALPPKPAEEPPVADATGEQDRAGYAMADAEDSHYDDDDDFEDDDGE